MKKKAATTERKALWEMRVRTDFVPCDDVRDFNLLRLALETQLQSHLLSHFLCHFLSHLADFGLSKIIDDQVTMKTVCGTPGYCGKCPPIAAAAAAPSWRADS